MPNIHIYPWDHSINKGLVCSNSWHDSPGLIDRFLVFPTIYQKRDRVAYNDFLTNFQYKVWKEHIYECNSHCVILWTWFVFLLALTKVRAYIYGYHKCSMHRNCASQPSGKSTISRSVKVQILRWCFLTARTRFF